MEKTVSQLDDAGYFIAAVTADESPLEPGVFLIPGGAVDIAQPDLEPGKVYKPRLDGPGWIAVEDFRSVARGGAACSDRVPRFLSGTAGAVMLPI